MGLITCPRQNQIAHAASRPTLAENARMGHPQWERCTQRSFKGGPPANPYDAAVDFGRGLLRVQVKSAGSYNAGYTIKTTGANGRVYTLDDIVFVVGYVVPEETTLSRGELKEIQAGQPGEVT